METMRAPARGIGVRAWLVIRITGVLLAVLALGHFAVMHIVNDVAATDSSFIARRWSSALWVVWDGLLLVTVLVYLGTASWPSSVITGPARWDSAACWPVCGSRSWRCSSSMPRRCSCRACDLEIRQPFIPPRYCPKSISNGSKLWYDLYPCPHSTE